MNTRANSHANPAFAGQPVAPDDRSHQLLGRGQDPHVLAHGGRYYYCASSAAGISLRVTTDLRQLAFASPRIVWTPPRRGPHARNLWAPELHFLDGRFYLYFAADDGDNAHHRMWVLGACTADPEGPYELLGALETEGWAIDGTVLTLADGRRYFLWSGWPGQKDGQQNIYIAAMKNPRELSTRRVLLASPDQPWERHALPLCEGPQVLQRHGRTFIVYSASGSWTEDYCLGLLELHGDEPLDPQRWTKAGRVFGKNEHGWGVGHCSFAAAPDGAGDWLLYHAKTSRRAGWKDREVRAQAFTWTDDGRPCFGEPLPVSTAAAANFSVARVTLAPVVSLPRYRQAGG